MKNILLFSSFLLMQFGLAQTKMTAAEAKTFTTKITSDSKNIKTLQADFVQTKKMDFMDKAIVSSGKMALQSPNQLIWKYNKPYSYAVLFKNNTISINNQGKKSTVDAKSKMFEKINKLISGSATGNMFSDPEFVVSFYKSGNNSMARFIPKTQQLLKYIKQIDLYFAPEKAGVSLVEMLEPSGDTTKITFSNTSVNAALPAATFSL